MTPLHYLDSISQTQENSYLTQQQSHDSSLSAYLQTPSRNLFLSLDARGNVVFMGGIDKWGESVTAMELFRPGNLQSNSLDGG